MNDIGYNASISGPSRTLEVFRMREDAMNSPRQNDVRGFDHRTVKSAMRVLDLFDCLGRWDAEMTHAEIAQELMIPKSSLTLLLKTLVGRNYLSYVPATKGYTLGPAIGTLANRLRDGDELVSAAHTVLVWMTSETEESSALNFIKGDKFEVVATVLSPKRLVAHLRLGDSAPLYSTSPGKALLAFLPEEMLKEYLRRVKFEKFAVNTVEAVEDLEKQLAAIRRTGIAYVVDEYTPGMAGAARPILSASGFALAALNIAVPVARFDEKCRKRCAEILQRGVEMIRQRAHIETR